MLKVIYIVTLSVFNIGVTETEYQKSFDYETVDRGHISATLADVWDTPAMAGREYLIMQPDSGADVYLRFVAGIEPNQQAAATSYGWHAVELLSKNPDKLEEQLRADSAFTVVGPTKDLYPAEKAPRAMQAVGPDREMLYFTRLIPGGTQIDLGTAKTFVDRVFIMVVGGPSMTALQSYYRDRLGMPVSDPEPYIIANVAEANGLPLDTTFPLSLAAFPRNFAIELDEWPARLPQRHRTKGALPQGVAMVSFRVEQLDDIDLYWRAAPAAIDNLLYDGKRAAVTVGPAGEWIELIGD